MAYDKREGGALIYPVHAVDLGLYVLLVVLDDTERVDPEVLLIQRLGQEDSIAECAWE